MPQPVSITWIIAQVCCGASPPSSRQHRAALGLQGQLAARRHGIAGVQAEIQQAPAATRPGRRETVPMSGSRTISSLNLGARSAGESCWPGRRPRGWDRRALFSKTPAAAEAQQLPRERRGPARGIQHLLQILIPPLLGRKTFHGIGRIAFDRLEQVVELVGDAARQLAHQFQLLRRGEVPLRPWPARPFRGAAARCWPPTRRRCS